MFGWQRRIYSLVRTLSHNAQPSGGGSTIGFHGGARAEASSFRSQFASQQNLFVFSSDAHLWPFHLYIQELGISTSRNLLAESSDACITPVASPLVPVLDSEKGGTQNQTLVNKPSKVQAIRKGIKQSPKKVNLVAEFVRGMRVEDALLQLQVTVKRAAKTVYQVIHSARANATHNHGLDPDRLLVAEAFVGKGFYKKRVSYHSKGRSGIKMRPVCRLTVVVRELTAEEEAEVAKLRVAKFQKLTKRERRLVPHKLIETTPRWGRKRESRLHEQGSAV